MTKKQFRNKLNQENKEADNHKHNRFNQRTRGYGDYLYFQDRVKFDVLYQEFINQATE